MITIQSERAYKKNTLIKMSRSDMSIIIHPVLKMDEYPRTIDNRTLKSALDNLAILPIKALAQRVHLKQDIIIRNHKGINFWGIETNHNSVEFLLEMKEINQPCRGKAPSFKKIPKSK